MIQTHTQRVMLNDAFTNVLENDAMLDNIMRDDMTWCMKVNSTTINILASNVLMTLWQIDVLKHETHCYANLLVCINLYSICNARWNLDKWVDMLCNAIRDGMMHRGKWHNDRRTNLCWQPTFTPPTVWHTIFNNVTLNTAWDDTNAYITCDAKWHVHKRDGNWCDAWWHDARRHHMMHEG
jgi:hypothetical protein